MEEHTSGYYVPAPSFWPIVGSIALLFLGLGGAQWVHGDTSGPILVAIGAVVLIIMVFGWFKTVINEHRAGLLNDPQVHRSFKMGFIWFVFTEFMLFAALFGVLFYGRVISVPQLGGAGSGVMTHLLLWPSFTAAWPLSTNPNPALFPPIYKAMETWGIPAINTIIILASGAFLTTAYWGVLRNRRWQACWGVFFTIILGIAFLAMQAKEYWQAYTINGVKLTSGMYGSTFFMLTGLDGIHVLIGVFMLTVILWRLLKGDFSSKHHFAFAATFWYWHFVEAIWLLLFVFVYWI